MLNSILNYGNGTNYNVNPNPASLEKTDVKTDTPAVNATGDTESTDLPTSILVRSDYFGPSDKPDNTESCGSLAYDTQSGDNDSESCGSLALCGNNGLDELFIVGGGSDDGIISEGTVSVNRTTAASAGEITTASIQDTSVPTASSKDTSSKNTLASAMTADRDYFSPTNQQKKSSVQSLQAAMSEAASQQGSSESASVSGQETLASASQTPNSEGQPSGGETMSSIASGAGEGDTAGAAEGAQSGFMPGGNMASAGQGQLASADNQSGSWAGAFVKEHTGWGGAYATEATSVSESAGEGVNGDSSALISQIASGTFGSMTGFRNAMMAIDGMSVPINSFGSQAAAAAAACAAGAGAALGAASASAAGAASSASSSGSSSSGSSSAA